MKSFRCLCVLLFVCASSAAYAQFAAEMGQHSDVQAAEQQISNLKSTYSFFKKYELITQQKNQPERRAEYSGIRRANAKQSCGIFFMQKMAKSKESCFVAEMPWPERLRAQTVQPFVVLPWLTEAPATAPPVAIPLIQAPQSTPVEGEVVIGEAVTQLPEQTAIPQVPAPQAEATLQNMPERLALNPSVGQFSTPQTLSLPGFADEAKAYEFWLAFGDAYPEVANHLRVSVMKPVRNSPGFKRPTTLQIGPLTKPEAHLICQYVEQGETGNHRVPHA